MSRWKVFAANDLRASGPHCGGALLVAMSLVGVLTCLPQLAAAQSLIEMYQTARFSVQSQEILSASGGRAVPLPTSPLPHVSDSMRAQMARFFPNEEAEPEQPEPSLAISEWRLIPKLGRGWFEKNFGETGWSFLGNEGLTRIDTTFTREIRARLEAAFGSPTQTMPDVGIEDERPIGDYIQFEYWFVLNDTIAMRVMDVNGPLERGVVVATERKYRRLIPEMRDELTVRLMDEAGRSPYADYYYLPEQRMWFVTGFDGRRYFLKRISKPNLRLGRPVLENVLDS